MKCVVAVVVACISDSQDLGSNPKSPIIFVCSFHNMILCRFPITSHHIPPALSMPCGHKHRSKGQKILATILQVKARSGQWQKVKRIEKQMGFRLLTKPHKGPAPPGLLFFFLIFFFLLILLIIIIIIIIIIIN